MVPFSKGPFVSCYSYAANSGNTAKWFWSRYMRFFRLFENDDQVRACIEVMGLVAAAPDKEQEKVK